MQKTDMSKFTALMQALCAVHGVDPSEPLIEGYWIGLEDLPIQAIEKAVRCALSGSFRFMPKAFELRELCGDMPVAARAIHAWDAVRGAMAKHGSYRSVSFDDPVINATIRNLGGWQKICLLDSEEWEKWGKKDFERIYQALCACGITAEAAKHLPGIAEQDAGAKGKELPTVQQVQTILPPQREGVVLDKMQDKQFGVLAETIRQIGAWKE